MRNVTGVVTVLAGAGALCFAASLAGATLALSSGSGPIKADTASALTADYATAGDTLRLRPLLPEVIDAAREDDRQLRDLPESANDDEGDPGPAAAPATTSPAGDERAAATPTPRSTPGGEEPAEDASTPAPDSPRDPAGALDEPAATPTPDADGPAATPSHTPAPTPTKTATSTPTPTPTRSPTPTPPPSPTSTTAGTPTPTPKVPSGATATTTPAPGATPTPTSVPTASPTPTPTPSVPAPTATPTPTAAPPPPPPDASGARGQLVDAWTGAAALLGSSGGAYDPKINSALGYLSSALAASNWVDDNHVTSQQAFLYVQQAAVDLVGVPGATTPLVDATQAMRALATILLNDAILAGGNPASITQGQLQVTSGDADLVAGNYAEAITHYRLAWNHADNALR